MMQLYSIFLPPYCAWLKGPVRLGSQLLEVVSPQGSGGVQAVSEPSPNKPKCVMEP